MASEPFESIYIENITVGSIQEASGIFSGVNAQYNWKSHEKTNIGFGQVNGNENLFIANHSFVYDPDGLDNLIRNPKPMTEENQRIDD